MTVLIPNGTPKRHIVLFAYEAWGHTRPLCNLSARIVRSGGFYITFIIIQSLYDRLQKELARNFESGGEDLQNLIRVIVLPKDPEHVIGSQTVNAAFDELYSKLAKQEPVTCTQTGIEHAAISSPDVVILDSFAYDPLKVVRKHSGERTRAFCWFSGAVSAIFRLFGPEDKGGKPEFRATAQALALKTGKSLQEAYDEIFLDMTDEIVRLPGLPPMYDYEYAPQKLPIPVSGLGQAYQDTSDLLNECDGIILSTPVCYEPESVQSVREWFAETKRQVVAAGPFVPTGAQAATNEYSQSPEGAEITKLLDRILASHGENSVLYFSHGSIWWSVEPDKIWAFLDVVMELKIPFIFSHASPFAVVPDSVIKKVQEYGLGILSAWCPQQTILSHEATGWFVTHGGHNSVMESISAGVPMICWPYHADQPVNAAHLSWNLKVAYEVFEGRNGDHGLKPVHRLGRAPLGTVEAARNEARDVLTKAFGEDGQLKRANVLALKKAIESAWEKDGISHRELEAFLSSIA